MLTEQPTAAWVVQQLREAFPFEPTARIILADRDSIFSSEVSDSLCRIGFCECRRSQDRFAARRLRSGTEESWRADSNRGPADYESALRLSAAC
jgi:hypothetical protein